MYFARGKRIAAPLTLLLTAASVLRPTLCSTISSTAAMAAQAAADSASREAAVTASGDVATKAEASCIVDVTDFTEPTLKQSRVITLDVESKWQGEGVGAK